MATMIQYERFVNFAVSKQPRSELITSVEEMEIFFQRQSRFSSLFNMPQKFRHSTHRIRIFFCRLKSYDATDANDPKISCLGLLVRKIKLLLI